MSNGAREKIAVVAVHGVGETSEGWINRYLVPALEKWAAFDAVGAAANMCRHEELLLVLHAEDRPIVVALDEDRHFRAFCQVAGIAPYAHASEYATRESRIRHRDDLIYLLSMIVAQQPAATWLDELHAVQVPSHLAFDPDSVVHSVRDPARLDQNATWQSFTRRIDLGDKEVVFSELNWADMARIGNTSLSRISALLQLFLESPFVLGKAFLKGSERGVHRLIARLVYIANWVMHWPIAGLNVAVFTTAFICIAAQLAGYREHLFVTVAGSLVLTMIIGVLAFRKLIRYRIGLAYLALSGALYAGILLGILGGASIGTAPQTLAQPHEYLINSFLLVLIAWAVWTITSVSAALLIILVAIKRFVTFGRGNIKVPLSRSSAALALSLILGMMWKAALALLGIMVINALVADTSSIALACKHGMTLEQFAFSGRTSSQCALAFVKALLIDVNVINTASILLFVASLALVLGIRRLSISLRSVATNSQNLSYDQLTLPRLIASPLMIAILFAAAIFNAFVLYIFGFEKFHFAELMRIWAPHNQAEFFSAGLIGIVLFFYFIRRIAEQSDEIIHIGRDIVDHQYDPEPGSYALQLQPAHLRKRLKDGERTHRYPRRQRIQRRLESLIEDVIVSQQVDRLIFVAHSQGTVIMHDYLMNHDNLLHHTHNAATTLSTVQRIDAMTLASPLSHIYRHYFEDYDQPQNFDPANPPLIFKVYSWTNIWRVDDPIGNHVDLLPEIRNICLGPGGHTDYWKEPAVCQHIWRMINDPAPVETCETTVEYQDLNGAADNVCPPEDTAINDPIHPAPGEPAGTGACTGRHAHLPSRSAR